MLTCGGGYPRLASGSTSSSLQLGGSLGTTSSAPASGRQDAKIFRWRLREVGGPGCFCFVSDIFTGI